MVSNSNCLAQLSYSFSSQSKLKFSLILFGKSGQWLAILISIINQNQGPNCQLYFFQQYSQFQQYSLITSYHIFSPLDIFLTQSKTACYRVFVCIMLCLKNYLWYSPFASVQLIINTYIELLYKICSISQLKHYIVQPRVLGRAKARPLYCYLIFSTMIVQVISFNYQQIQIFINTTNFTRKTTFLKNTSLNLLIFSLYFLSFINSRLNMSHHCKDCKQKHCLFTDILRARKLKLEREKRIIDRVLHDKIRKIPELNPEKRFIYDPSVDSLEHYSDSQFSINGSEYKISITKKPKSRFPSPKTQEEILNERAKQFITRLRKQKQYNEGKMVLLRKREEEKRELEAEIRDVRRKSLDLAIRKQKMNKLMDSIILHEGKISERAIKSLKKQVRSKTESSERDDLTKSLNMANDAAVLSLRKRVKEISDVIDSYQ